MFYMYIYIHIYKTLYIYIYIYHGQRYTILQPIAWRTLGCSRPREVWLDPEGKKGGGEILLGHSSELP